jgi:squalene-hopene/tetraprenyl-beta-curcumene cyclase
MYRILPFCCAMILLSCASVVAQTTRPAAGGWSDGLQRQAEQAILRGSQFLIANRLRDGGWPIMAAGEASDPAITAIVGQAFAQQPAFGPDHAVVRQALQVVLSHAQPDGGIYTPQMQNLKNYYTSVALMFLSSVRDSYPRAHAALDKAQQLLIGLQWDQTKRDNEDNVIAESHAWFGGAGYGEHQRPDLSNTQMMLEALHQSGLPADHPVYQKALRFIGRCQMLSQANDQPFARGADDGGFIYTPVGGGESKAGTVDVGGVPRLRSYGSMTYAGFKSMLYADVGRDDVRVQRALDWIRSHWTLDANPNMPGEHSQEGLYYYYHVFARAMAAWGQPQITDKAGRAHDWRAELVQALLRRQQDDGSWVNDADRWEEGNPYYVTALAVLSLQTAIDAGRQSQ